MNKNQNFKENRIWPFPGMALHSLTAGQALQLTPVILDLTSEAQFAHHK